MRERWLLEAIAKAAWSNLGPERGNLGPERGSSQPHLLATIIIQTDQTMSRLLPPFIVQWHFRSVIPSL